MGQRLNSQAKNANENNAAASTADQTSGAEYRERLQNLDPSIGASGATSLGKRRRAETQDADDTSALPQPRPMGTSPSTWDRNPEAGLEALTARAFNIDGLTGLATPAGTSSNATGMSTFDEFRPTLILGERVPGTITENDLARPRG